MAFERVYDRVTHLEGSAEKRQSDALRSLQSESEAMPKKLSNSEGKRSPILKRICSARNCVVGMIVRRTSSPRGVSVICWVQRIVTLVMHLHTYHYLGSVVYLLHQRRDYRLLARMVCAGWCTPAKAAGRSNLSKYTMSRAKSSIEQLCSAHLLPPI